MDIETNDSGKISGRTKISADFTLTMLAMIVGSILSLVQYLKGKKVDDLYTELWFLGIIFFLLGFVYFLTRPKVYFDNSNLYFKRINKSEQQIPLKDIRSIFNNLFFMGKGIYSYEIEYLDGNNEIEKIKFKTNKWSEAVTNFKNTVRKINPTVEIV